MALLTSGLLTLRHDPRVAKLPPYLSLLCILAGIVWLFILPLNEYSRGTYISENALLPGQVHTYFGGSEHNIFRAYRHEVADLSGQIGPVVAGRLADIFEQHGLKVGRQKYVYRAAGRRLAGENVYAILQGPRADATEAVVLLAAWRNMDNVLNQSAVALVLTLARYFKRWSLWSKDIIFVITEDSTAGPQAWVDAYHSTHDAAAVEDLPIKAGALQGAIALDYPAGPNGHRFDKLHIVYDGINGQLPNLDLLNTVALVASGHMGIACAVQRMLKHENTYADRLQTLLRGILTQGIGQASGPHSSFMPYHVDAITLQTVGDGWHDEMSLGRLVESSFRSLNNLLEHLHQSFFFYLLMEAQRFVSIGTYLPSAMLIAVNFSITSIALWLKSGRSNKIPKIASADSPSKRDKNETPEVELIEKNGMLAIVPKEMLKIVERSLFLPLAMLGTVHFLGLIPLYIFHSILEQNMPIAFVIVALASTVLPILTALLLSVSPSTIYTPRVTSQHLTLALCFSTLLLGVSLATLSTLNFSLGLIVGLFASPLSFIPHVAPISPTFAIACSILLNILSPTTILFAAGRANLTSVADILAQAAAAWTVGGTWTAVVVWLVWWPAWLLGSFVCASYALGVVNDNNNNEGHAHTKKVEGTDEGARTTGGMSESAGSRNRTKAKSKSKSKSPARRAGGGGIGGNGHLTPTTRSESPAAKGTPTAGLRSRRSRFLEVGGGETEEE